MEIYLCYVLKSNEVWQDKTEQGQGTEVATEDEAEVAKCGALPDLKCLTQECT